MLTQELFQSMMRQTIDCHAWQARSLLQSSWKDWRKVWAQLSKFWRMDPEQFEWPFLARQDVFTLPSALVKDWHSPFTLLSQVLGAPCTWGCWEWFIEQSKQSKRAKKDINDRESIAFSHSHNSPMLVRCLIHMPQVILWIVSLVSFAP